MYDLSLEQIAEKRPTSVFALYESGHIKEPLLRLGVATTLVEHRGVAGILESYSTIGRECGVEALAATRVAELRAAEREIQATCAAHQGGKKTPTRVMVVVGRATVGGMSSDIYISGRDGFYSDILRMVGAVNVHSDRTVAVPTVSSEGIVSLNPDVILEVVNVDDGQAPADRRSFWSRFARIPAVVNNRVFILHDDFASIPGPRYILLAKKLSSLLCGG
jgi:iron complex transport system substrate-binding protein